MNPAIVHHQQVPRLEFRNSIEHRLRSRHITQSQIGFQCVGINRPGYLRYLQQRFDFRSERQEPVALIEVERLDSQSISRNEQPFAAPIPNCEGEHAAKVVYAGIAVLLISMDDRFGVRTRLEVVAELDQFPSKIGIVVDNDARFEEAQGSGRINISLKRA